MGLWTLVGLVVLWLLPRPREIGIWLLDHVFGDRFFHWVKAQAANLPPDVGTYGAFVSTYWYHLISGIFLIWLLGVGTSMLRDPRPTTTQVGGARDSDADRFAVQLDHGFSLLVRWRNAPQEQERRAARDEAMGGWLSALRDDIQAHYGKATAIRFNFPATVADIGTNEPAEHEARLKELSRIINDIKGGALPRIEPRSATQSSKERRKWLRPHEDVMRRQGYEKTYSVISPDGGVRKWTRREIDDLPDEEKERLFKIHPALADWWLGKPSA